MNTPELKELIKKTAFFDFYRQGHFYYHVSVQNEEDKYGIPQHWQFPIPLEDIGTATLNDSDKGILFMRWIRKAMAEGTLIKINTGASNPGWEKVIKDVEKIQSKEELE